MKSVNTATQQTLENFRKKAADLPWSAHPYAASRKGLDRLGKTEWDEEHRNGAIGAMTIWIASIVGNSLASTMNEIVALMRIAAETGDEEHKKAADEMATSMNFLESVCSSFMETVDAQYIAEQIFEDGVKMEKERAEEEAAAEAAKAKVKAFAEQLKQKADEPKPAVGTVHRKWEPSAN
jgi:hypothetical protein